MRPQPFPHLFVRDGVWQVAAAAKLNLSLTVLGRRPDGFHDIESLIVPVSLHDTVRVRAKAEPGISLAVRFGGRLARLEGTDLSGDVPTDDRNLAVRAARELAVAAGLCPEAGAPSQPGLAIELVKRIPSGSGLGGGSSDAAAVLMAAAAAWGIERSAAELAALGARIGSDVPVFFAGGAALVAGRGERIEAVGDMPPLHAVIVRPAVGLSTAAVYNRCVPDPHREGASRLLAAALAAGQFRRAASFMHNSLESPARELCPEVARLLSAMGRAGARHAMLTGSGSACFALARSAGEARRIAARLRMSGWACVFVVRLGTGMARSVAATAQE